MSDEQTAEIARLQVVLGMFTHALYEGLPQVAEIFPDLMTNGDRLAEAIRLARASADELAEELLSSKGAEGAMLTMASMYANEKIAPGVSPP